MADEKDNVEEEGEGKGKGKLFIIIGVVVLLLIGGAAAFFLMGGEEEPKEGEKTEESAEAEEDEEEEEGEKIAVFHALPGAKEPGLVISLNPGTKFKQVQISMRFMTYKQELVDYLAKNDPMIRHHVINLLGTQDPKKFMDRAGREELQQMIKDKIVELLENSKNKDEKKLKKKLEEVYFSSFILQ